jgi:hypothetical protein
MKKALVQWDENLRKAAAKANGVAARQAILERGRSENGGLIKAVQQWSKGYRLEPVRPV